MLIGDEEKPYESADDELRVGGESDGVREGARDELCDAEA